MKQRRRLKLSLNKLRLRLKRLRIRGLLRWKRFKIGSYWEKKRWIKSLKSLKKKKWKLWRNKEKLISWLTSKRWNSLKLLELSPRKLNSRLWKGLRLSIRKSWLGILRSLRQLRLKKLVKKQRLSFLKLCLRLLLILWVNLPQRWLTCQVRNLRES